MYIQTGLSCFTTNLSNTIIFGYTDLSLKNLNCFYVQVDMVALREMDEDDLKSLGIDHTISRKRIIEAATPKVFNICY